MAESCSWTGGGISRDLAVLSPEAVARTTFSLEENDFVGYGAKEVLHRCTPELATDQLRLRWLHVRLVPLLVSPSLWAPNWTLSHTEDLCCEVRRWEAFLLEGSGGRKRKSGGARAVDSQLVRRQRLEATEDLGFSCEPAPLLAFSYLGVVRARAGLLGSAAGGPPRRVRARLGGC